VSAKAGEDVKRKKYKGAVQGFVVEAGGPAAKKFIDEVVAVKGSSCTVGVRVGTPRRILSICCISIGAFLCRQ
jgi:hypothetical protein